MDLIQWEWIFLFSNDLALRRFRTFCSQGHENSPDAPVNRPVIAMRPPTIVHIEGGRMDAPKGDRLMELLAVYGVTDYRSFYSRVRNYTERRQPIDELKELIVRISPERVVIALEILKQVAEGKRVIAV